MFRPVFFCLGALWLVAGLFSARGEAPRRDQCLDGLTAKFVTAASVPLETLYSKVPQLPPADNDGGADKPGAKPERSVSWGPRPAEATVKVERIARHGSMGIFRAVYELKGDDRSLLMVLAYGDVEGEVRPFFIASDPELRAVSALIVSDAELPFAVEANLAWKGFEASWNRYLFQFDAAGPHVYERAWGEKGEAEKRERYGVPAAAKARVERRK
jgi:hypothetical protein